MSKNIFIGDYSSQRGNPINDRHYQALLGLNPTLSKEIKKYVETTLFSNISPFSQNDLYDNSCIIDQESIEVAKKELGKELKLLEELTGESQCIYVVVDSCFTNKVLLVLLRKILGKEAFVKHVKIVNINYQQPSPDEYLEEQLLNNHSLILLGGSLSDAYDMHPSHYDGYLSKIITQVSDDYYQKFLNKRFLGIGTGQQFLANIIGVANKNSSGIIATIKGPEQFTPSNATLQNLEYVNCVFGQLLKGLTNNGTNTTFSSVFTRRGYVTFDLLKNSQNYGITPLILDDMTGGVVGWGSKNGNILGIQFHPEIQLLGNIHSLRKNIKEVLPNGTNQELFLENFQVQDILKRDIAEAFYV